MSAVNKKLHRTGIIGYAPQCWAQTTAYFPPRTLRLVSLPRTRLAAMD
jgi:hypothetical protein